MLSEKKLFPDNIKFPCLVHFDRAGFDDEIEEITQVRAATAADLETLMQSLSSWKGESVDKQTLLNYLRRGNYKIQLTEFYRKVANIPDQVRLEKITEVYEMPDVADLVELSERFDRMSADEVEAYFQGDTSTLKPPKITASEKNGIKTRYSFLVHDEKGLKEYQSLRLLCEVTNLVNNGIEPKRTTPKIEFGAAKHYIPNAHKYLKKTHPDPDSRKYILEIDYHAFK